MINNKLIKAKCCPICNSKKKINIGKINSHIKKLENLFDLLKCLNCDHRYLSKLPKRNFLNDLYKNESELVIGHTVYRKNKKKELVKNKFKNVIGSDNHWVFKYINKNKKSTYLEIGPGLCNLYKSFYDLHWKCEGVELQNWIKAPGIVYHLKKIKKKKKDVVVMLDVLEHNVDPIKLLKKISKIHKKSGKLFLSYPNSNSFKSIIQKTNWPMVSPLAHINFFSKKSTTIMLNKCGYKAIKIKSYSFVSIRRLLRNSFKLPFKIILDIFNLDFVKIFERLNEFFLNILDLINGDQLKVIAKKK